MRTTGSRVSLSEGMITVTLGFQHTNLTASAPFPVDDETIKGDVACFVANTLAVEADSSIVTDTLQMVQEAIENAAKLKTPLIEANSAAIPSSDGTDEQTAAPTDTATGNGPN